VLERHLEGSPGAFTLTHATALPANFQPATDLTYADETHWWSGTLRATSLADGGLVTQPVPMPPKSLATLRFIDDERPLEVSGNGEVCDLEAGRCWKEPTFETGWPLRPGRNAVWVTQHPVIGVPLPLRPQHTAQLPSFNDAFSALFPRADVTKVEGHSLLALGGLFETRDGNRRDLILVERADGAFDAYPFPLGSRLLEASDTLVEFRDPAGRSVLYGR